MCPRVAFGFLSFLCVVTSGLGGLSLSACITSFSMYLSTDTVRPHYILSWLYSASHISSLPSVLVPVPSFFFGPGKHEHLNRSFDVDVKPSLVTRISREVCAPRTQD